MGAGPTAAGRRHLPGPSRDAADSSGDEEAEAPDDAASPSAEAFSDRVVAAWSSLAPSSSSSASSRVLRRWSGDPASSPFAPPRQDPCLHAAFEAFQRASKPVSELASSMATSSGAAAHAVILASEKLDALKDFLAAALPPGVDDDYWRRFFDECVADITDRIMPPLRDAAKILSGGYGRGVSAIRSGVIAAATPSIQSFLKTFPPADGFFFGNPTQQLTASMNYAVMAASLAPKAPAPRRPPPPRAAPPSRPPARSAQSSASRGKAPGRSFRGGKAGQKK